MSDVTSETTTAGADHAPDRVPTVFAEVRADGTGEVSVDGAVEHVTRDDLAQAGAAVTGRVAELAAQLGVPVPVQVRDPDGLWALLIHPDGRVDEAPPDEPEVDQPARVTDGPAEPLRVDDHLLPEGLTLSWPSVGTGPSPVVPAAPAQAAAPAPAPMSASAPRVTAPPPAPTPAPVQTPAPALTPAPVQTPAPVLAGVPTSAADAVPAAGRTPVTPAPAPASGRRASSPATPAGALPTAEDLVATRRPRATEPAQQGWRRGIRRATFGVLRPGPGRAARARRAAVRSVRRPLDGPRTVVIVNPKGGAHKTTATLLLATTFGLQRGGYTLAWDNNETHGTLGWRASPSEHNRTAVDLLRSLPQLSDHRTVRIGDLDEYVRTQQREQFDVLASDENPASAATVDATSFHDLHRLLSQFYRVLFVDTGNNMRSSNWRAAVNAADQLVVVSTVREDTAQSAAWALDALRAMGHEEAVRSAVTVLSAPAPVVDRDLHNRLRAHFGALTRVVVDVPFEPALVSGGRINYDALRPGTRDAWLAVSAAVTEGL